MDISVNLDINKAGQFINEPVTMRSGETDNVIKATIFKNNKPYTDFKTATFNGTRSNGAVIANDPTVVNGNVISYSVAPTVTANAGKLRNSYFLLDGKTSTESFEVAILPGVSVGSDIGAYIPGLQEFQDEWKKVNAGMTGKLDDIDKSVDTFLAKVQTEIDNKNSKFTDDQKAQITSAINDLKNQVATSKSDVNAMDNKLAAIKDSVKDFDVPQITADTKEALDKVKNMVTGAPNLIRNSSDFKNTHYWEGAALVLAKHPFYKNSTSNLLMLSNSNAKENTISGQFVNVEPGENYTLQFKVVNNSLLSSMDAWFLGRKYGSKNLFDKAVPIVSGVNFGSASLKSSITTFNMPNDIDEGYLRFDNNGTTTSGQDAELYLAEIKLAQESQASPYAPSPDDKLNVSDTGNYQKNKITNDDGSVNLNIVKGGDTTQDSAFINTNGLKTFYVQVGADGNTTNDSILGLVYGTNKYGYAIGVNNLGKAYFKSFMNDNIGSWQELATVPSTTPVAATAYSAMVQNADTSAVKAQNAQIAYSLMTGDTSNAK